MIEGIRIQNFKPFSDTGVVHIAPITLLVGPNSSGKSSILQFISLLAQSSLSSDVESPLSTRGKWVDAGSYPEFIHKGQAASELKFELYLPGLDKTYYRGRFDKIFSLSDSESSMLDCTLAFNRKTTKIYVRKFSFYACFPNGERRELVLVQRKKTGKYEAYVLFGEEEVPFSLGEVNIQHFHGINLFSGRKIMGSEDPDKYRWVLYLIYSFGDIVSQSLAKVNYVGPLRESPVRIHQISGISPSEVGKRGELAVDLLWAAHRSRAQHMRAGLDGVREWMKKLGLAKEVELNKITNTNYYRLALRDSITGHQGTLADVGFGVSQVLPILAEIFFAPSDSLSLVEQPEIHLHPKAQSALGDAFIAATRDGSRRVLVETHSEHLLTRLRRRVAEGEILPEDVAVYYATPAPEGTTLKRAYISDDGSIDSLPIDFFSDDFEELRAILLAKSKKKENKK